MRLKVLFAAVAAVALVGSLSGEVRADRSVVKYPGRHPDYIFEAEPHLVIGLASPGPAYDAGIGVGFRGAIEIVDNGFVGSINNTVAIGFGMDFAHYDGFNRFCRHGAPYYCGDYNVNVFWFPVVMQWNFWLSENWSVFGEPGFALRYYSIDHDFDPAFYNGLGYDHDSFDFDPFVFYAGGRWHFSEKATLTMRIGYPTFSVGVSFLL